METRERQLELAAADRKAEEAMLPDYENTPGAVRDTGVYSRVYRPYSSGGAYGLYNCKRQKWVDGAWVQAESGTVKCLVTVEEEAESNEFGSGDLFLMIGPADSSGVAPVLPLFYAFTYGL